MTPSRNVGEWFLKFIDVEDFKSYKGVLRIGPLRPFIAIVGPNGSGKSNLMDVISFVMGERTSTLRGRRVNQLIHGAHVGRPVATQAKVSAVFSRWGHRDPDEEFVKFTRTIRGTSCDYAVNDEVVNHQTYLEKLETLGINVKGKNFLVFQGAVESVAIKSPKERTHLLEEICGSGALKEKYEKFQNQVCEAEKKLQQSHLKKKSINVERQGAKMELEEAKQYKDLQEQMAIKELEMNLFKLFNIQQDIVTIQSKELNNAETEGLLRNERDRVAKDLKVTKKKRGELDRQLNLLKNKFFEKEKEKTDYQPKLIEHQEKHKNFEKKLKASESSLEQAEKNKLNHEQDLQQLRQNMKEIQKKEELFFADQNERGNRDGVNITLRDSQIQEYWGLKKQVIQKTHTEKKSLDTVENKKNGEEDVCKSLNREGASLKAKLEVAYCNTTEKKKLAGKVDETISELKEQLRSKNAEIQPLTEEIRNANERVKVLQDELETISQNISHCKMDKHELARLKRRQDAIETLQKHFKGVHDRVMHLYKPRHDRYKVAITKIMGKNMDAIIVDSERTARQCVEYLREQMLEPEVFLPLDLLIVKPLRDRFRDQITNVHLAFDILEFDPKFKKAMLHCTKSTVICPNPEIASQVAAGECFGGESTNAVSFDGTYFATSGIISGGQAELVRRIQRVDNVKLAEIEQKKEVIKNELREALKTTRKCDALNYLNVELQGIRDRLKFAETDRKTYDKDLEMIAASKAKLEEELALVNKRSVEAETTKSATVKKLKEIQTKVNLVEDEVFRSFCEKVNIHNIREYEDTDIRDDEDFNRKKDDFQKQIQTVQGQIDYETSEANSLQENIIRWSNIVKNLKESLRSELKKRVSVQGEIEKINKRLEEDQKEISQFKKSIETETKDIKEKNTSLAQLDQKLFEIQKTNAHLQNVLAQNQLKRHEIFKFCKLAGIDIPFFNGHLEDVPIRGDSSSTSDTSSIESNFQSGIPGISKRTLEIEENLKVNFSCIGDRLEVSGELQVNLDALEDELQNLQVQLGRIHAPNLKADQKWEKVKSKLREHQTEFDLIRNEVKESRTGFENVKKERLDKFMTCFNKIATETDKIYKELTQNSSAQAMLGLENPEEPYLDGVSYNCVAPGKRFQPMNNLSGGEKALAALALLFAMHSFEPSPFFVLDEVDAALDNTNIHKVVKYIRKRSYKFQVIVISHKEEFYAHADALIGVSPGFEETDCIASDLFFLSLEEYQKQ